MNRELELLEKLEKELSLKQLQIRSILTMSQAVNDDVSFEGLGNMCKSFLSWEMAIPNFLFIILISGEWKYVSTINVDEVYPIPYLDELVKHKRLHVFKDHELTTLKDFDIIIPVNDQDDYYAYCAVGGIKAKEDLYNKIQFITTLINNTAVAIKKKDQQQLLLNLTEREANKFRHVIELNEFLSMQTSLIQYFTYFDEYVKNTKGENIKIDINKHEKGLEFVIDYLESPPKDILNEYLKEYLNVLYTNDVRNFLKENLKVDKGAEKLEELEFQLNFQKRILEEQLTHYKEVNKMLHKDKSELLSLLGRNSNTINIDISNSNNIQNTIQLAIKENLETIKSEISDLQSNSVIKDSLQDDVKVLKDIKELIIGIINENNNNNATTSDYTNFVSNKLIPKYRKIINAIKDSKTILLDSPKVINKLIIHFTGLKNLLLRFGESFKSSINNINEALEFLKQLL